MSALLLTFFYKRTPWYCDSRCRFNSFFQLVISASTSFSNNYKGPCFSFSANKVFIHLRGLRAQALRLFAVHVCVLRCRAELFDDVCFYKCLTVGFLFCVFHFFWKFCAWAGMRVATHCTCESHKPFAVINVCLLPRITSGCVLGVC